METTRRAHSRSTVHATQDSTVLGLHLSFFGIFCDLAHAGQVRTIAKKTTEEPGYKVAAYVVAGYVVTKSAVFVPDSG